VSRYVACPVCRSEGKDSTGNHLKLFEDGKAGWCMRGHGRVVLDGDDNQERRTVSNYTNAVNLSVIKTYPIQAIPSRKISEDVCRLLGVVTEVDETDGSQKAVYYPYHDDDGEVTGYKKRTLPKDFSTVGKPKGLFGKKACKEGAKFLILVEGEHDVLAAREMLRAKGKNWNVVSIPNGANEEGKLDAQTLKELHWIVSHETVCIVFDTDQPGTATATAMAEALASQVKVGIASLPRKDTAKCWEDGLVDEWFRAISNPKVYRPEQIVEGKDVDLERLRIPKEAGFNLPYPKLQKMTWGLRKGEILTLTAGSGIGKSTFAIEILFSILEENPKSSVAIIALETSMEDVARRIIAMDNNVPWARLAFNPDCIPKEAYERSYNKFFGVGNRVHLFKHWGSIDVGVLKNKMLYYAKALGVDFVLLDHVSMTVAGTDTDERKDIDMLYASETDIVVETGIGIINIIHLKRVAGKKFNKGDEVELTDLRGSAGAEQMSWAVWALERNQQAEDGARDLVRIRDLKNRTMGFTGLADTLRYDHSTGRLLLHTIEEFDN
jgi:twinkle protein